MSEHSAPTIRLNERDNVVVARRLVPAGTYIGFGVTTRQEVGSGHKVAIADIAAGTEILKYGQLIGYASRDISRGEHVHLQNVMMHDVEDARHEAARLNWQPPEIESEPGFMGFDRGNGLVGTRNYIGIITTVNCSATVSRYVADHFNRNGGLTGREHVDGVVALTHGGGCAINTKTEGYRFLTRTIAGYARNPNFGGVLMIGLGCETNQIDHILDDFGLRGASRLHTMTIQKMGGTRKTIDSAIDAINGFLDEVDGMRRTTVPVSGIKLALECGGSDGYSGISANPALGYASDLLVAAGGTSCLAETPEIYGAEHLLARRATSGAVSEKLMQRIDWWRDYTASSGAELNNNPSFGNKEGGLTTILEKSLGAVAKAGTAPLSAVYEYAEIIDTEGLVFMDTPGYDPVAVTGQVAGGCNVICFTTGRGSVSGFKPAPCIKIATNTEMYEHMQDDMDINAGTIVSGDETIEQVGRRIYDSIVAVAGGDRTLSEVYNYGDNEFVPWQVGAVT